MKGACTHASYRARRLLLIMTLCVVFVGDIGSAFAAPNIPAARPIKAEITKVIAGQPALGFTLADIDGHKRALRDFRGRQVALFFFCGCSWCRSLAQTWGQFQRGGALQTRAAPPTSAPVTLVVFSGDAASARAFAADTELDLAQTVLLPDPTMAVTQTLYHADPCPRTFVLDRKCLLRYTNNHADDTARKSSEVVIASRMLDALRHCASPPSKEQPEHPAVTPAPVLNLPVTTFSGKPLNLAAQPGWKVIYFWSTTCPCVRACESFTFVPLARKYQGKVSFFAVASNGYDLTLPRGQLVHKVQSRHLPFPLLLDDQHQAAKTLDARITPQTCLLDPHNRVVFSGIPDDSRRYQARTGQWGVTKSYLSEAIAQALAGQPVTVSRVKDQGCIIAW